MQIRLVYFPVRAKAECARMCLAYARIPWVDESVQSYYGSTWPDAKAKAPFGQLPLMVVDGAEIAQVPAIVHFIASQVNAVKPGFVPADPLDAARCDSVFFAAEELAGINPIVNVFRGETWDAKKAEFFSTFPPKLKNLDRVLGDGPFFCGAILTYADLNVWHYLDNVRTVEPTALDEYHTVLGFMSAVAALPGVQEYLASRPKCVDIGTQPRFEVVPPAPIEQKF